MLDIDIQVGCNRGAAVVLLLLLLLLEMCFLLTAVYSLFVNVWQGVKSCQALVDFDAVYIAILPPSLQELERRLRRRGTETKQSLQVWSNPFHW